MLETIVEESMHGKRDLEIFFTGKDTWYKYMGDFSSIAANFRENNMPPKDSAAYFIEEELRSNGIIFDVAYYEDVPKAIYEFRE